MIDKWYTWRAEQDSGAGSGGGAAEGDTDAGSAGADDAATDTSTGDSAATIKALRAEAAANRVKAREANEKLAALEVEKLTETERAKKEAADSKATAEKATADARSALARAAVAEACADRRLNVTSVLAFRMVQPDLEFDDEGEPTNVAAVLDKLIKDNPALAATSGDTNKQQGTAAGNSSRASQRAAESGAKVAPGHDRLLAAYGAIGAKK